jgi:hypothetical protein
MAVNQVTAAQLQSEVQAIFSQLENLLSFRIAHYAAIVLNLGTSGLQAAPYSMSAGDATDLFNAANDLDKFRKVWTGLMYVASGATLNTGVPTANDATHFGYPFNSNPGKCAGLGY